MNERNNSGMIQGYTPAPQAQQYPQQYQPQQQYQQAQPVQQYQYPQQYQPQQQYQPVQQYPQQYQYQQPQQYQQPVYQSAPNPLYREEPQQVQRKGGLADFFKRRDVLLLIAAIICTVWLLISYNTIGGLLEANQPGETAEELGAAVGTAIGAAMTIPFFILAFIGQVFNWLGWIFNRRGFALTAGILYCVSLVFGFSYGLGIIPCIVLAFIGYARLKKKQK